ncbi:hypothetical protein BHM03_00057507 [Ensete ventricosum]|nr:hypothetical protein BHM03_00057507 [Ensete ventricosum]
MLRWTDFRAAATAIECRRGSTEMDGWWWWRREGESAAIRYFSRYYPLEIILPNKVKIDDSFSHFRFFPLLIARWSLLGDGAS